MTLKKKEILLIINPKSGKRKVLLERERIEELLETQGTLITYHTNGMSDLKNIHHLKIENPGIHTIVVCGGDGTLNIALSALHHFHDVRFIFLPYGSVNVFARENKYPKGNLNALRKILTHGQERIVYPGFLRERAFILMSSIGVDSFLVSQVEKKSRKFRQFSYIAAFIKYALRYDYKKEYSVTVGKKTLKGNLLIVSNCKKYGGFLEFTPNASFFHNEFEVFAFQGKSFFSIIRLCFLTLIKKHACLKNVSYAKGAKVLIEGPENTSQMDGEIGARPPFEIKKDKGVRFVLPA